MAKPGEEGVTVFSEETQYYCPWILSWFTQRQLTESHNQQISNVKHLFEAAQCHYSYFCKDVDCYQIVNQPTKIVNQKLC